MMRSNSPKHESPEHESPEHESIVQRLKTRIAEAKSLGFQIRNEWLDGLESTWCELGGVKILFLDLSISAAEQLQQVDAAIAWHRQCAATTPQMPGNQAA